MIWSGSRPVKIAGRGKKASQIVDTRPEAPDFIINWFARFLSHYGHGGICFGPSL
jgi:hypothetical protein